MSGMPAMLWVATSIHTWVFGADGALPAGRTIQVIAATSAVVRNNRCCACMVCSLLMDAR